MDREKVILNACDYAKHIFDGESSGHDWFHTLRVYRLARSIACAEGADEFSVALAALLHDVDDRKLSPETCEHKDHARAFLKQQGIADDLAERIVRMIDEVSFRGTDSVRPSTLEGCCVQDADRLDALGAVGIARTFAFGGSRGRLIYDPEDAPAIGMDAQAYHSRESTSINHFYEKLLLLKDMMNTAEAKRIAEHRDAYLRAFLQEFLDEWEGKC